MGDLLELLYDNPTQSDIETLLSEKRADLRAVMSAQVALGQGETVVEVSIGNGTTKYYQTDMRRLFELQNRLADEIRGLLSELGRTVPNQYYRVSTSKGL